MELKEVFGSIFWNAVVPISVLGLIVLLMEYLQNIKGV